MPIRARSHIEHRVALAFEVQSYLVATGAKQTGDQFTSAKTNCSLLEPFDHLIHNLGEQTEQTRRLDASVVRAMSPDEDRIFLE